MRISQRSYFVTQLISRQDTSIANHHYNYYMCLGELLDVLAITSDHRPLGHHVAPTDANLSAVLLCHTVNISAQYKHCTIALPISATIITDVSASYRAPSVTTSVLYGSLNLHNIPY